MTLDELVNYIASNIELIVIDIDLETGKSKHYIEVPETNWIDDEVYDHKVLKFYPIDQFKLLIHTKKK